MRRTTTPLRCGILASKKKSTASKKKREVGHTYEDCFEFLKQIVNQDPFQSTRDLAVTSGTTHTCVKTSLKCLGLVKKLGRFVPRRLGQLNCDRRIDACTTLLTPHKNTNWLRHLIIGNEKWIFFSNLHRKAKWVGMEEQAQDVPKQDLHPKMVMVSVWWNIHGVVHWQLLDDGATTTANIYVQQLRALKAKVDESGDFVLKIYFQHDKARPHIAREVKMELCKFGWTILPHSPYSSDRKPSDYCFFRI
ncbi:transposase [Oesophagostomum dentatum]|uniref:Transposase n=1 Tax=Oesophagostomum dentatum TaxID=61180 RepID=A0A0B1SIL7_OESDE|nr:transposase [Oesophagostomum dentatum]